MRKAGYEYGWAGENIAGGSAKSMDAFINPETAAISFVLQLIVDNGVVGVGHRRNILNPHFKDIGVGFAHQNGGKYVNYLVMDLGAPL